MTQNNNNAATAVAPAASQTETPAVQPAIVEPVTGDAVKVETVEKT